MFLGRDEKHQLLLGIRRANRQPVNISSSVLSTDSMHIGILAAAAHAAANNSRFTVFYNPRSMAFISSFYVSFYSYNNAYYFLDCQVAFMTIQSDFKYIIQLLCEINQFLWYF